MIEIIPFKLEHLKCLPVNGRVSQWYFDEVAAAPAVMACVFSRASCSANPTSVQALRELGHLDGP